MRVVALLLAPALLLAACGAAPGGDALFPLAEGRRWTYQVSTRINETDTTERAMLVMANRGSDTIDGAPSWRRRSDSGIEYWLRSDATGIYRIASRSPLEREPQLDNPRRYVLQKPYAVGTEWEAPTTAYVLARKNEVPREVRYFHKPFPMHYRIEALAEKVHTPAGAFEGCMRVTGRAEIRLYDDTMFRWRDMPLFTLEWYCPGVGLVRLERKEPTPSKFMVGGSVTMELASWQ